MMEFDQDTAPDKVIFPDMNFRKLLQENAEKGWLEYCEANGLNPEDFEDVPEDDEPYPF